jgi:demethylmenaquinone methyltransferase/2-methoxy-6-polyprenyl-1,4-benzoquinol methylase
MPTPTMPPAEGRFAPRASREMAGMFDGVVSRYDLLNRLMTLGLDHTWRLEMAKAVPESARVVVDLCTGNGVSADALRRTGRLVVGVDVSLGMLEQARGRHGRRGWAPRFACADAFAMPLADGAVDAVTVAFGMRNLRPRGDALVELARVLRPGGVLSVLEATAPGRGVVGTLHGFWLRHVVPLLGRLSSDASAYRYLSDSIFEFGPGDGFERDARAAGFELTAAHRLMLGAATLWVARKGPPPGASADARAGALQFATGERGRRGDLPQAGDPHALEWRVWTGVRLVVSVLIVATLVMGYRSFVEWGPGASVPDWQRLGMRWLLILGVGLFGLRSILLLLRLLGPPRPR